MNVLFVLSSHPYLRLRDVHHAHPNVRASLRNHGHGRPANIPGTHAAYVVLKLIGGHGHRGGCCSYRENELLAGQKGRPKESQSKYEQTKDSPKKQSWKRCPLETWCCVLCGLRHAREKKGASCMVDVFFGHSPNEQVLRGRFEQVWLGQEYWASGTCCVVEQWTAEERVLFCLGHITFGGLENIDVSRGHTKNAP